MGEKDTQTQNQNQTQNVESGADAEKGVDYIETIKQLKENTVPKETYAKLQEENKKLLQSLVNGETIEAEEKPADVAALRKELYGEEYEGSDLNYVEKSLELRKAIIDAGGTDPFLPYGKKIMPTDEDIATAERVADVLQECVEYAEGDNAVFVNELQRRMVDSSIGVKKRK